MAELENLCRRFGLSKTELSTIPVPDKKEVLRAALAAVKAKGNIDDEDREYIRTLAHYLNAGDLLKPCLMDLELYERLFAIRRGNIPVLDPGNLILERSEKLHYVADTIFESYSGGTSHRAKGTLYVGSFRMRFVRAKAIS